MKKIQGVLILVILMIPVIVGTYYGTSRIITRFSNPSLTVTDAHDWIHEQLVITEDQEKALEISEKKFIENKKHYIEVIRLANKELAEAILEDKEYSLRVKNAVEKIQETQGELQKATLEHLFEMKAALTEEQYQKLLNLTANALYQMEYVK